MGKYNKLEEEDQRRIHFAVRMSASIDQFFHTFNSKIEAPVRSHLKTVYVYLTMSVLSATAGAYLHMVNGLFWNFGLLGALASMGLVMGLHFTPDNGKNRGQRTAMLLWLGLLNIFFRSPALFQLHLWGGLLIFCGFVVYDTQAIIEKRRRGDKDAIRHSLDLFIDFIQLFRKILILLMQKENNRNDDRRNKRR